jgi:hypothetical protein
MVNTCVLYNECVPPLPGTMRKPEAMLSLVTGDYFLGSSAAFPPFLCDIFVGPQDLS